MMFKRIIKYSNKHFSLFNLIENITDKREKPQIPAAFVSSSILYMLFSNLGSLNKFNTMKNILVAADNFPSAATIARSSDGIDLEILRQVLKEIYLKAKRSKMFAGFNGKFIGIIDGHEICSSSIHKCDKCSVRDVSKIEGVIKLNYYHKYTAFILAGEKFSFLLDIEPIYPGEGELSSSYRLLNRVCRNYPKAFEVFAGDALFLAGHVFNLLVSHHKYAAAVLKDERRHLFEEGLSLSKQMLSNMKIKAQLTKYGIIQYLTSGKDTITL